MNAVTQKLIVRHTTHQDIEGIIELQKIVYPEIDPWEPEQIANQLNQFPQGQVVVELDGRIVGCASSLIVLWDEWHEAHTWTEITAHGHFDTHTAEARTLYGAEVCVLPGLQGYGIGHALYEARRTLCRAMNLKRIIACGRLPGYAASEEMSVGLYAQKVVWGDINDPVLSFQLHEGFRFCGVVEGYLEQDKESEGYAALIVWLNPDYDPEQPTRIPEQILES